MGIDFEESKRVHQVTHSTLKIYLQDIQANATESVSEKSLRLS